MSTRHLALKEKPFRARGHEEVLAIINNLQTSTPIRWICNHHTYGSDIEGFVQATQSLEIIAETRVVEGVSARANAELIARAVNEFGKYKPLIASLVAMLERCQASDKLSNLALEIEGMCGRARRIIAG